MCATNRFVHLFLGVLVLFSLIWMKSPETRDLNQSQATSHSSFRSSVVTAVTRPDEKGKFVADDFSTPTILWWDPLPGLTSRTFRCPNVTCHVTTDRETWRQRQVQMLSFYGPTLSCHELPVPRREGDVWALYNDESPKNRDFLLSHRSVLDLFNYTASFQRTSHFSFPTQWLHAVSDVTRKDYMMSGAAKSRLQRTKRLAPVLYVQSDCHAPSDRDHYVSMLQRYVAVDSYGACLNNRHFPNNSNLSFKDYGSMYPMTSEAFYRFVAQYKFTIAIENAACPDYVTEKFWRAIRVGAVPIVFGAPNIKHFLPDRHAALVVDDFESVEALAAAIRYYDDNDDRYDELLSYKYTGVVSNPALQHLLRRTPTQSDVRMAFFHDYHCFLCEKLLPGKEAGEKAVAGFASSAERFGCDKPGRFDDRGRYVKDSDFWNDPWRHSQAEGCVMRKLVAENKQVTQETFDAMVEQTLKHYDTEC